MAMSFVCCDPNGVSGFKTSRKKGYLLEVDRPYVLVRFTLEVPPRFAADVTALSMI
jgi:hypothetical protein